MAGRAILPTRDDESPATELVHVFVYGLGFHGGVWFVVALIYGYAFQRTRSLAVPVLLHRLDRVGAGDGALTVTVGLAQRRRPQAESAAVMAISVRSGRRLTPSGAR